MIKVVGIKGKGPGMVINTTSRDPFWGRNLSPFFLKTKFMFQGVEIEGNVENAWQYSKVYPEHYDEKNFWPKQEYFNWAHRGMIKERADRYPMGKGSKPLFSFWNGNKLGYIDARKEIYIPLYARAVVKTPGFDTLKNFHGQGLNITLQDFDGYDNRRLKMSWHDVIHCEERKMGHAFVIAMLLEGAIDEAGCILCHI